MRTISIAWNSKELINQYNHYNSGHFFDRDTMRFFASRVTENYRRVSNSVAYFITTEKSGFNDTRRVATIRKAELIPYTRESDGYETLRVKIETVGDFARLSLYEAKKALKGLK